MNSLSLFETFLEAHKDQLVTSSVPIKFWNVLYNKLEKHIFDGGEFFDLKKIDYTDVGRRPTDPVWRLNALKFISAEDPNNIFLVDHAWLCEYKYTRETLTNISGLLDRMCNLMGIDIQQEETMKLECVLSEMWRFNLPITIRYDITEPSTTLWYVMDEMGTAIQHSSDPNFRVVPFIYLPENSTYTLIFPIKDVNAGYKITRDFVENMTHDPEMRRALELPWVPFTPPEYNWFQQDVKLENNYFAFHTTDNLPENIHRSNLVNIHRNRKYKVYSEYVCLDIYLTDPEFEITDDKNNADILWLVSHFKDYRELSITRPHVFINQFPFEHVITIKDFLAIVCRRYAKEKSPNPITLETYPSWLPTTFNLNKELLQFISYYTLRANKNMDNYWICKPWNLARGIDIQITKDLHHIMRLLATGPKIAQKYITRPVLYNRPDVGPVKFDIRYIVVLKSVVPLRIYAYKKFFLRFANLPFAMNKLDVYQQHFTVMNYSKETPLYHLKCRDFIINWDRQYPEHPWRTHVESKILFVLREVFKAAVAQPPPMGIAENPQSRALYAVDLILEWEKFGMIQPKLLEVNFTPDCRRACEYYPRFFNDIFRCMFFDNDCSPAFHVLTS